MELKDYLGILKRRFGWFILTFLVGVALYAMAYYAEPFTYDAKATLLIQIEVPDPLAPVTVFIPIRPLGITAATREQLMHSEEVFEAATLIREAAKLAGKRVSTLADAKAILVEHKSNLLTDREALSELVQDMMTSVTIARKSPSAQIVDILAVSNDPQAAIEMANAHAIASEDQSRREVLASYEAALADIEQNLNRNTQRLQELQGGLDKMFDAEIDPAYQRSGTEAEIRRIRDESRKLRKGIAGIDYSIQRIQAEIHCRMGPTGDTGLSSVLDLEASPFGAKVEETEAKLVAMETYYKEEHPEIVGLRAELKHYKQKLPAQHAKVVGARIEGLMRERQEEELDLHALEQELDAQVAEAAKISERYTEYAPLKRELDTVAQDSKDLMSLKRRCELLISSARPFVEVRREATEAIPSGRKMPASALFWLLSATIAGLMVAYLREYLDTVIATEYDIRKHLNLPVFAIVPFIDGEKLSFVEDSGSALAESYNTAATLIRTALLEGGFKCLGVCSAKPQEGKTTVSINLATAFARKGLRTLLIDSDMRRPEIHNMLRLDNSRGLSTLLGGRVRIVDITPADSAAKDEKPTPIGQFFLACDVENLFVLPSGPLPPSPTTLLETVRFNELMTEAKKTMDMVIVDSPPICTVSDALTLSTKVDANIFVVGAGLSEQREVHWAKHLLANVHARVLGVILNMARERAHVEYYYYYSSDRKKVKERA